MQNTAIHTLSLFILTNWGQLPAWTIHTVPVCTQATITVSHNEQKSRLNITHCLEINIKGCVLSNGLVSIFFLSNVLWKILPNCSIKCQPQFEEVGMGHNQITHNGHKELNYRQKDVRPGVLAGNSICQHCIHSKIQNEPQRGYKETNVVHFSHCCRLNFDKPCDALFVEVVQLKVV